MKQFYILFIALCFTSLGFGQTVIYDADFTNDGDGFTGHTTGSPPAPGPASVGPFGTAPNAWSLSYVTTPGTDGTSNTFEVVGGELQSDDWGGQGIFTSQIIDVSGVTEVDISATTVNSGAGDNIFKYFYILDGGAKVETANISSSNGDPVNYTITALDVTGIDNLEVGFEFSENGSGDGYDTSEFTVTDTASGSTETPDFCNLQFPGIATITAGNTVTVYAQIYEAGNTPGAGAGTNITAEIGISAVDATSTSDFDSEDWTWTTAPYLGEVGNNDEYSLDIGASLLPGTHYYVSRFSVDGGPFAYGGSDVTDGDGGNFWDGTNFVSGVLTVDPKPEPSNHVTSFTATADSSSQITLTWNDNDGAQPADGFLIVGKTGAASFFSPVDGTDPSDDTDWSDDEFEVSVASGVQTYVVTGLSDNTQYDFKIYAYTNSGSNIDFKTDGTIPEDSATTFENPIVIITEIMQNPLDVIDDDGEYFEVYNPTSNPIDMNNWTISDNGSDSHTINSSVVVPVFGFVVFGINGDNGTNGGVNVDYAYSGIALSNSADEIILTDNNSNEVDRVEYDGGPNWPDPAGASMIYKGSTAENNNDGSLWGTAIISEGISPDKGSPGINGLEQILTYLVYSGGAWNTTPSPSTGSKNALVRSMESVTLTSDASIQSFIVEPGAGLIIDSGVSLTGQTVDLESNSSQYASLKLDGTLVGTLANSVVYRRYVNEFVAGTGTGGNDLITSPVTNMSFGELVEDFENFDIIYNDDPLNENSDTTYLFGPFDNSSENYTSYFINTPPDPNDNGDPEPGDGDDYFEILLPYKGYRAATNFGSTLLFRGGVNGLSDGTISTDDFDVGSGTYAIWNLVGNPYPSYLDSQLFLTTNGGVIDQTVLNPNYNAIYGYNDSTDGGASGIWTIINSLQNNTTNIAPGQGFFVASNGGGELSFTPTMRLSSGGDDFIQGRVSSTIHHVTLALSKSDAHFNTDFYFTDNSTRGLDPGYDAGMFGGSASEFSLYSHLVEDNSGIPMAIQALGISDMGNTIIPLGINASQGEQVAVSITESDLPATIEVYLEDNITNTFTLLNEGDYTFTPTSDLADTGRFFLRFEDSALSTVSPILNGLQIYSDNSSKSIVVKGQLTTEGQAIIFDMLGRVVKQVALNRNSSSQSVDVSEVSTGIYVVQVQNNNRSFKQKVVIK